MTMDEIYFCLNVDGRLYNLGLHNDYDSADAEAEKRGLYPVWLFGQQVAEQWVDFITTELK